ncbi:hypothetical protein EYC84_011932 [Monilinia fructicola]|uniref:Vacuolar protein sorting-associated protein 68 n=1 Tax=Monilinia fructicola TaxID=38448 RepID=A0A5M9J9I4_MONFR|nr:hypothetical protein EYC84_011932 [Monilinia fructicola]
MDGCTLCRYHSRTACATKRAVLFDEIHMRGKERLNQSWVKIARKLASSQVTMSEERLWKFRKPEWMNSATAKGAGVYTSGALFSLSFFILLDAALWSKSALNGSDPPIHITFIDWLPLIFSSLGMLIINSIEKSRLSADSFSYSGSGVAWKARVVLFLGFASLAGGLAGGITVLVLKYVVPGAQWPTLGMGVANVGANAGVMLSSVVLWISQNIEDEYSYNLAL